MLDLYDYQREGVKFLAERRRAVEHEEFEMSNKEIDREAFLTTMERLMDVNNSMDDPPDYHMVAGGGTSVADSTWFVLVAHAGCRDGEELRARIAKSQATQPHFEQHNVGNCNISESGSRPVPPPHDDS